MKKYKYVDPKEKEKQLLEALEIGLNRSLNKVEKRYVTWFSETSYETSGLLLNWVKELSVKKDKFNPVESKRLQRTLDYLKNEFFTCGEEWKKTKNNELLEELHGLVGAINQIEIFMFDKPITTIIDIA